MKGTRPISYRVMKLMILCGFATTIGCMGSHPEEGTLKLPPRNGEVAEAAKPVSTKVSPAGKKNRLTAKEDPVGK